MIFQLDRSTGSHAEAGSADEGDDEAGQPGQHHVGSTAQHRHRSKHLRDLEVNTALKNRKVLADLQSYWSTILLAIFFFFSQENENF